MQLQLFLGKGRVVSLYHIFDEGLVLFLLMMLLEIAFHQARPILRLIPAQRLHAALDAGLSINEESCLRRCVLVIAVIMRRREVDRRNLDLHRSATVLGLLDPYLFELDIHNRSLACFFKQAGLIRAVSSRDDAGVHIDVPIQTLLP